MSAPGFWDDTGKSQHILKERTTLEKIVQMWDGLNRQVEDVRVMIELGEEAQDEETLAEVAGMNDRLQQGVEAAEFQRMLSGPHDRNSCFVSINAGAGGTESQDWAEMLLRMYLRYCEKKGWKTDDHRLSGWRRGRESKRSPSASPANTPTAISRPRPASTVWCASRPLTATPAVTPPLPRSSPSRKSRRTTSTSRSCETDLRIDTYRSSGAGGQHVNTTDSAVRITHLPTGHRGRLPERAEPAPEQGHRHEGAARQAV